MPILGLLGCKPPSPKTLRKIAMVNFGGIGDEVLFSPVIEAVKASLPESRITLILENRSASVAALLDGVDEVIGVDIQGISAFERFKIMRSALAGKGFDAVIASGGHPLVAVVLASTGIPVRVGFDSGRPTRVLLSVAAYLAPKPERTNYAGEMYFSLANDFLRWLSPDYKAPEKILPHLKTPKLEELHWAKTLLPADSPKRKILIHPGVSTVSVDKNILKGWSIHAWAELIRLLSHMGHQTYLVGGPDDRETVENIQKSLPSDLEHFTNLYGQTRNLGELAALIKSADLLIGVDSSPMHIAVGYNKPVVAMFGPTDEKTLLPENDMRFRAITVPNLPCRPCLFAVRSSSCDQPDCLSVPVPLMLSAVEYALKAF